MTNLIPVCDRKRIAPKDIRAFRESIRSSLDQASAPEEIEREYHRLSAMFDRHIGLACYEIGNEMLRLGGIYHLLTEKHLRRRKAEDRQEEPK